MEKKTPQRMCLVCRQFFDKKDLIRVVKIEDGFELDETFKKQFNNIVEQYDIEITSLMKQDTLSTKGISFKIIDKAFECLPNAIYVSIKSIMP